MDSETLNLLLAAIDDLAGSNRELAESNRDLAAAIRQSTAAETGGDPPTMTDEDE